MDKKKTIVILISALLVSISLCFLLNGGFRVSTSNDAKSVREIPRGFVHLPNGGANWDNGMRYILWESQISFLDVDGNCIFQTDISNRDFIVKYKKEYYVNEEQLLGLIDIADSTV